MVEFIHCTFSLSLFTLFVFSFASLFLLLTLQAGQKLKVTGTVRVLNLDSLFRLFLQFKLTFPAGVCGSNHFVADFFPSSVTITITTITTTLTSFLDHSDEDSHLFHFTILKSLFSRKSKLQRPMNGFMLFAKKFRLELIQQHPGKDNR